MANSKKMDFVILGILSHESMTGYEIKKAIDSALSFFWSGSYGSIYPTLNILEQQKMVEKQNTSINKREKYTYSITELGREYLEKWLELPVDKDELHYETLLKLFFGKIGGPDIALSHIEDFEKKIQMSTPFLESATKQLTEILDEDISHKYYLLTVKFGEMVYHTYLEWCEEAKKILLEDENTGEQDNSF